VNDQQADEQADRVPETPIAELPMGDFVRRLGEAAPTPGGGAVAGTVGAIAAALARMVVGYASKRTGLAEHADLHEAALDELATLADRLLTLADADARAYGRLNALMKRPKDDRERVAGFVAAVEGAVAVPREAMEAGIELLDGLEALLGTTSKWLDSDLAIAGGMAHAAVHAAAWNVRANLSLIEDAERVDELQAEIGRSIAQADLRADRIEAFCSQRLGLS